MDTPNLSAWDIANEFSGADAAALIHGFQPGRFYSDDIKPALGRMKQAHQSAVDFLNAQPNGTPSPEMLCCVELEKFVRTPNQKILELGPSFTKYMFFRAEIVRWLAATGLKSVYQLSLIHI